MNRGIVVIPTYNEAENLPLIVPEVLEQDPRLEVLVVDDNSPDGTGRLADELAESNGRVHVLHRPEKQGLGPAYRAGLRMALEPRAGTRGTGIRKPATQVMPSGLVRQPSGAGNAPGGASSRTGLRSVGRTASRRSTTAPSGPITPMSNQRSPGIRSPAVYAPPMGRSGPSAR